MKSRKITKIALCISIGLMIVWFILGATSSVAWFKEEDVLVNTLLFGNVDINLYYKTAGSYEAVDEKTEVFDDSALYEPGYTQVVYFKVENADTLAFDFDLSVVPDLSSTVIGTGVLGNKIDLADYIKFGLIIGDTEEEVMKKTESRDIAKKTAVNSLSQYSENGGTLNPGEVAYAAIVLYMPEDVDNVANYRGDTAPKVGFGIAAIANQKDS